MDNNDAERSIKKFCVGKHQLDENGFPIINKTEFREKEWQNIGVTGLQNASPKKKNDNMVLLVFNYDYRLLNLWNTPLKKIGLFQSFYAIATPDFSIYPEMNINDIRHNVYMSRWLGKTW